MRMDGRGNLALDSGRRGSVRFAMSCAAVSTGNMGIPS
jgi:hypothetical protein